MVLDKLVDVEDKVGGKVEVVANSSIKVPEEDFAKLAELQQFADNLDGARRELGRLTQITHNLVTICNTTESKIREIRKELAAKMGLQEGRWAIDFENKAFVQVNKNAPNVV